MRKQRLLLSLLLSIQWILIRSICFCCCCCLFNDQKDNAIFINNNKKRKNSHGKITRKLSSPLLFCARGGSDFVWEEFVPNCSHSDDDDDEEEDDPTHKPPYPAAGMDVSNRSGGGSATAIYYGNHASSSYGQQQPPEKNTHSHLHHNSHESSDPSVEAVSYYPSQQRQRQHEPPQQPYFPPPPFSSNNHHYPIQQHGLPPPELPGIMGDPMQQHTYPRYASSPPQTYNDYGGTIEDDTAGSFLGTATTTTATADSEVSLKLAQQAFDKDYIFEGLKRMYRKKIMPLEIASRYAHFSQSPPLSPSDFDARPMILLIGQYSVGKTSFIRYLLGNRDFPGMRIGPEPTTDRFTILMDNEDSDERSNTPTTAGGGTDGVDKTIPGAALAAQGDKPFRGLSPFGNAFLSRLEGICLSNCPILKNVTLVDTPGILAGRKQSSLGRNYDYEQVMKWFAERADLIIIMFDAHKLDISDELKKVIELMIPHQDKVRVLLNKADQISTQQLMRVYGALMWSLGKVMNTPEVCRVYIGSFWGSPLAYKEQALLFQKEQEDLLYDISQLPVNAVMRRINELVKRARSVKVHAYIIHYLRKQLPYTWGKRDKQRRLIERLDREFVMCARRYELPKGDFPPLESFRQALLEIKDLSEFPKLDKRMVREMDKVFSVDIPQLLVQARMQ
jgi:EH domain-containing protein 1